MRRANGEGTIYKTIQKIKRKVPLKDMCPTCQKCNNKSLCNNRIDCKKCPKCQKCTDFSLCDMYYCYEKWVAQTSINGKVKTIASGKKMKETSSKKIIKEDEIKRDISRTKNEITLPQLLEKLEKTKLDANIIKESSYARNLYSIRQIKKSTLNNIPIINITDSELQEFFNSLTNLSQSVIEKTVYLVNAGFKKAVLDNIISQNPMDNLIIPCSLKERKKVTAFDVEEQRTLIKYITQNKLIIDSKCSYNELTLKNLFLLALFLGARIGELGALNYDKHIDFDKKTITIERTLTKDKNYKVIIGTSTKTGKKKNLKGIADRREVPFSVFKTDYIENILNEQIKVAKNNPSNSEHLLFCKNRRWFNSSN